MAGLTSPPATFFLFYGVEALALRLQGVESVLRELKKFVPADAQVVRVHDDGVERFGEELAANLLAEWRVALVLDEAAAAGDGLDDALMLELGVGLGDGVAIDAEVLRERPDTGKGFPRLYRSGGGGRSSPGRPAAGRRPCRT